MDRMKSKILVGNRRSKFEDRIESKLQTSNVTYSYEPHWFEYIVPSRPAKYTPDFLIGTSIYLEAKGNFNIRGKSADERKKLILVRKNNPDLDLRLIFQDASKPIYRGAKVSHGEWATSNGFLWADGGVIPEDWIIEAKKQLILENHYGKKV